MEKLFVSQLALACTTISSQANAKIFLVPYNTFGYDSSASTHGIAGYAPDWDYSDAFTTVIFIR